MGGDTIQSICAQVIKTSKHSGYRARVVAIGHIFYNTHMDAEMPYDWIFDCRGVKVTPVDVDISTDENKMLFCGWPIEDLREVSRRYWEG